MKASKLLLALFAGMSLFIASCGEEETCSDGIKNQDETEVDCGGTCTPCATCDDGIKNGDETDVDCGGSCDACATCDDGIQNGDETGVDCGGSCDPCAPEFSEHITCKMNGDDFEANLVSGSDDGTTLAFQSDQSQDRQLFFELPSGVAEGTYDLTAEGDYKARYAKILEGEFVLTTGSITITRNDATAKEVSGTFTFTATRSEFGEVKETMEVTDGSFDVEY